jgi:hypothetical protein
MLRIALIALATLATVAVSVSPAAAQAGSPVRTLRSAETAGSTTLIAPKEQPCAETKTCKLTKRYSGAPSLGW